VNLSPQGYDLIVIILATALVFSAALMLQSIFVLDSVDAQDDDLIEAETYIVTLKNQSSSADLDDIVKSMEQKGANVNHVYSHSINGFSVQIPPDKKTEIMYSLVSDVRVKSVELDQTMTLSPPLK
jgi:peptidase inhibitor I9